MSARFPPTITHAAPVHGGCTFCGGDAALMVVTRTVPSDRAPAVVCTYCAADVLYGPRPVPEAVAK